MISGQIAARVAFRTGEEYGIAYLKLRLGARFQVALVLGLILDPGFLAA